MKIFKNVNNLKKNIIIASVFAFVIILSLVLNLYFRKWDIGTTKDGKFMEIYITTNTGMAFSFLDNASIGLVFSLQLILSLCVLAVGIFIPYKVVAGWTTCIATGGLFNAFDKIIYKNVGTTSDGQHIQATLDYFKFGDWCKMSAVFNFPDMCSVIGCFGIFITLFVIIFITQKKQIKKDLPISLFIDSTQKNLYIAISQEDKIISKKTIPTHNNLTDLIIEHIKKMLKSCNVEPNKVNEIYLCIGPGSFTGCRMGSLIAKTWSNFGDIKIRTISSLLLQSDGNCISVLDAFGDNYYYCEIKDNKIIGKVLVGKKEEANELAKKKKLPIILDYNGCDIFNNFINKKNQFILVNSNDLKPLYIKDIAINR